MKLYSDLSSDEMVKISPISADKIGIVFKLQCKHLRTWIYGFIGYTLTAKFPIMNP